MTLAVVDCETDPFKAGRMPEPFVWCYVDETGREEVFWEDTEGFIAFLREQNALVYAHNGGRFDWHFIADRLDAGPITILNGRLAAMRLGRARLRDSGASPRVAHSGS